MKMVGLVVMVVLVCLGSVQAEPSYAPDPQAAPSYPSDPQAAPSYPSDPQAAPSNAPDPQAAPSYTPDPQAAPSYTPDPQAAPSYTLDPSLGRVARNVTDGDYESDDDWNICQIARTLREPCGPQGNITDSTCLAYGCCWDPTHDELEPAHCYRKSVVTSRFRPNTYVGNYTFCSGGQYELGDVDGDGFADQFCFDSASGQLTVNVGDSFITMRQTLLDECKQANGKINIGDINGDGRSDVVCASDDGGVMVWESKEEIVTFYEGEPWQDEHFEFCAHDAKVTFFSDFNGDGNSDGLCIPDSGPRSLALGDAAGTFLAPIEDPNFPGFCNGTDNKIHVGDFDADGRSDLVCRMNSGEKYSIALTEGDGLLVDEDFTTVGSWCDQESDTFLVGDTNGDHHDDWICHHSDGKVCTKYNSYIFGETSMFAKETCDRIDWCINGDLLVADYNDDDLDDLFCRSDEDKTSIAESTVKAPHVDFIQTDWNTTHWWGDDVKFCADKELYVLDANDDNKQDVLCHDHKAGLVQRILGNSYGQLIWGDKWESDATSANPFHFCYRDHQHPEYGFLVVGDVDGDDRDDILCHYPLTGDITMSKADQYGTYHQEEKIIDAFCVGAASDFVVGDFDGNGKMDAMCRSPSSYRLWNGDDAAEEIVDTAWCIELYEEILSGKFLDGRKTELLCHNRETGTMHLLRMNSDKSMEPVDLGGYNSKCLASDAQALKPGDYDGDGFTDLLCHNQTGEMRIAFNQAEHRDTHGWFAKDFITTTTFCPLIGSELQVFDANGDGYDDLTCHTSIGTIQISESHIVGQQIGAGHEAADTEQRCPDHTDEWCKPVLYFPFESGMRGLTSRGKIGNAIYVYGIDMRLNVSVACIAHPDACAEGGSMAIWISVVGSEPSYRGVLSSCNNGTCLQVIVRRKFPGVEVIVALQFLDGRIESEVFKAPYHKWFHIAVVANGPSRYDGISVYKNGRETEIVPREKWLDMTYTPGSGEVMVLGRASVSSTESLRVRVDELAFWNRKLNPQEVHDLYNIPTN